LWGVLGGRGKNIKALKGETVEREITKNTAEKMEIVVVSVLILKPFQFQSHL
jgi:hypothetical protein